MRLMIHSACAALLLAASALAGGGLGPGEKAPWPEAKETVGISSYSPKDMEGKVVFVEVFRTW